MEGGVGLSFPSRRDGGVEGYNMAWPLVNLKFHDCRLGEGGFVSNLVRGFEGGRRLDHSDVPEGRYVGWAKEGYHMVWVKWIVLECF